MPHLRRARDDGRPAAREGRRPGRHRRRPAAADDRSRPLRESAAGPAGDLYVVIRVKEDERFIRDREDLVTVVDVAAPLAALGTTIQVPTLDGDVPLEIPAGTQPGETIMMAGRGLPPLGRGRTGDLRVVVNVVIPRKLSRKQRDLLEQLADSMTEENLREPEGMLAKLKRALAG